MPVRNGDRLHETGQLNSDSTTGQRIHLQRTACFNCRASRQKCDRLVPCARCSAQERICSYPANTNRGRKQGSVNKPDTVEKLLSRIRESPVGSQVIAAIIASAQAPDLRNQSSTTADQNGGADNEPSNAESTSHSEPTDTTHRRRQDDSTNRAQDSLISPLHILAGAVETERLASLRLNDSPSTINSNETHHGVSSNAWLSRSCTERLINYFKPQVSFQKDWQVLASQSPEATMKLSCSTCDPLTSRLLNETDVARYFDLFFKIRNPLVCLLDPLLHTPDNVQPTSFTLFSVICALGCAISDEPRDRSLYPALLSLAEGNIKWSIAASVKSIETIQAIFCLKYWSPIYEKQTDDPYWLHLSHGIQIARELGLNKPKAATELVNAYTSVNASSDFRERFMRNIERTWLAAFFAEKSFGIVTGRAMNVSRTEVSDTVSEWWRKPMTCPFDRITSGVVEIRVLLLELLEQRERTEKTRDNLTTWQSEGFYRLNQLREKRCMPDDSPSAEYLPILHFYMDHSILVFNANALRDFLSINAMDMLTEPCNVSRQTVDVACRSLDLALNDPMLLTHMFGYHNNQFIMVCHAASEILFATSHGCLPPDVIEQAAVRVRAVARHMETITRGLPSTSVASLYTTLSHCFARQLDGLLHTEQAPTVSQDSMIPTDWWNAFGGDPLDSAGWVDIGDLFPEQLFPGLSENDVTDAMLG